MTDTKHSADVYAEIMQLPATPPDDIKNKGIFVYYYQRGYREACHAAAELAKSCAAIAAAAPAGEPVAYHTSDKKMLCFADCLHNWAKHDMVPLYGAPVPAAAPKAALTDEDIRSMALLHGAVMGRAIIDGRCIAHHGECDAEIMTFSRAIEAASGPNAALVEALKGLHKVCQIALAGNDGQQHEYFETRAGHFVSATPAMEAAQAALAAAGIGEKP